MTRSSELPIFLANYGPPIARTAYLLTGDPDRARDLAVEALVAVGRRWASVRWGQPAHDALRELYRRHADAHDRQPTPADPPADPPTDPPLVTPDVLATLPPRGRAALVACYHDGLPPQLAATVAGQSPAAFEEELRTARARLRAAHPDLFTFAPPPTDEEPASQEPHDAPPQDTPPPAAAWTAPWTTPAAATPTEATPTEATPTGTTPAWTAPGQQQQPWSATEPADDPALRSALVAAAAAMPHVHLSDQVLRRLGRRRRIRAAAWTAAGLGVVGALVGLGALAVTAVARNAERLSADPAFDPAGRPQRDPAPMPAVLTEPVHYAYTSYCGDTPNDAANPQPCGQWRLVTTSGAEWRLPGAGAGYDEATGDPLPLAVSQDGRRLGYRDNQGSYVIHDLPTGVRKRVDVTGSPSTARIVASPGGRYFAFDFPGSAASAALLDFQTGVTRYTTGSDVEIIAVGDDGSQVVSETEDVTDVPGHASVTTLELRGPAVYAGGYSIDPALVSYGGALSPDGRTLALVADDRTLVTMDVRTGRVAARRATLREYDVVSVERWLGPEEVLVRQYDDDYIYLTRVDVRTGQVSEYADDVTHSLDYEDPLGRLGH
ncbi:hypothetical protein MF672_047315 [Actinomadura sp. ATCC 31491]|uniref:Uncharacterized protein n=1 Tax=Actinomadura luzonensis TaxID=2805427 RepID=A0ABT0G9T2_9ACTN|nr:hypothetical protein [Actinomadura luzonensis]MCK2221365.1 hypothetical protein [Actinomadura luzonensis]